jgi:probable HAF family extracellular repeat protein
LPAAASDALQRVHPIATAWSRLRRCYVALLVLPFVSGCWQDNDRSIDRSGSFAALGSLPGYLGSEASAVSADGRVVAGSSRSRAGLTQAFRWTSPEGLTALGFLPQGSFTTATAISANGAVIVGNADGGNPLGLHAFRWTSEFGLTQLAGLPNAIVCAANAVSAEGSVVAGTCLAPMNEAFRWTPATGAVGLGRFGTGSNSTSTATAVSGDGAIIGGAGHPILTGAVIWDASNVPTIIGGLPGDTNGTITALSRDGTVAAGISVDAAGHERGFRWTSAREVVPLATTGTFVATIATAISADGRRITGWAGRDSGGPDTAVLWDESGALCAVSDLLSNDGQAASAGWSLTRARGISADGRVIVGEGIDPEGTGRGWIVTLSE